MAYLSDAANKPPQGLAQGSRSLLRDPEHRTLRKTLQNIDAAFPIVRHTSQQSIDKFILELDIALAGRAHAPAPADGQSEDSSSSTATTVTGSLRSHGMQVLRADVSADDCGITGEHEAEWTPLPKPDILETMDDGPSAGPEGPPPTSTTGGWPQPESSTAPSPIGPPSSSSVHLPCGDPGPCHRRHIVDVLLSLIRFRDAFAYARYCYGDAPCACLLQLGSEADFAYDANSCIDFDTELADFMVPDPDQLHG